MLAKKNDGNKSGFSTKLTTAIKATNECSGTFTLTHLIERVRKLGLGRTMILAPLHRTKLTNASSRA